MIYPNIFCLQGLERVIISKTITKYFHEKIERLALDLVKLENEQFSLMALKLLVTCMYIGMQNHFLSVEIRTKKKISTKFDLEFDEKNSS